MMKSFYVVAKTFFGLVFKLAVLILIAVIIQHSGYYIYGMVLFISTSIKSCLNHDKSLHRILIFGTLLEKEPLERINRESEECLGDVCNFIVSNEVTSFYLVALHITELPLFLEMYKSSKYYKLSKQKMLLYNTETPWMLERIGLDKSLKEAHKYFNIFVASYYHGCSIYYPYGTYLPLSKKIDVNISKYLDHFNNFASRGLGVFPSCDSSKTNRLNTIKTLNLTFPFKIVTKCLPSAFKNMKYFQMRKKFKFYLSIENCVCEEFITDDFWIPLKHGIIPITYGSGKYEEIAPPGSYIDLRRFEDSKSRDEHLTLVSTNFDEYIKYFNWTSEFYIKIYNKNKLSYNPCTLCNLLNNILNKKVPEDECVEKIINQSLCEETQK